MVLCLFFLFFQTVQAYEVDNFSARDSLVQDALPVLDSKVNGFLDRAARDARLETPGFCSVAVLRQEILRWIRPDPTGILELWIELTDSVEKTSIGVRTSVYRGISFFDSPIMKVFGIGRSFKLAGQIVGTDKIGHFFMQGLDFYDRVRGGTPIGQVLEKEHGEDGIWGLGTSGVKSWADIAANYQGYLFWSRLVEGPHPYFRCEDGEGWVRQTVFTWADYVNPAWDEALNCSEMKSGIREKVDQELKRNGWGCPVDPGICESLRRLEYSDQLVSPSCRTRR
jgi:hypothetical protein